MKKMTLFFLCFIFSTILSAQPIRELVFFGDSLTDNGNLYNKLKFIPKSPPYYKGQFSNGPIWAEYLAATFKEKYGTLTQNYSIGGATVVSRSIFKGALPFYFKYEVKNYLSSQSKTDKNAVLYLIWLGANDYMDEQKQPADLLVKDVINEMLLQIKVLVDNGGKNFVIIDLPDLSKSPYATTISQEKRDRLRLLTQLHHESLVQAMNTLRINYPLVHFVYVDGFSIFNDVISNIQYYNQKYHKHLVNLTESCWTGGYTYKEDHSIQESMPYSTSLSIANDVGMAESFGATPCKNPDDYLFWDAVHPTVAMHEIFANIVIEIMDREFVI